MTDYESLPYYESKATPEEVQESYEQMKNQVNLLLDQHRLEVPVAHVKIRCGCLRMVRLVEAYRCLYCGIFFCKKCAERHFGMRVPPRVKS